MRMENPLKQLGQMELAGTDLAREIWQQDALGSTRKGELLSAWERLSWLLAEGWEMANCQQQCGYPSPLTVTPLRWSPVWHRHGQHVSRGSWLNVGAELYLNSLLQTQSNKHQKQMCFKGERVMWIQPTTLNELVALKSQYPNAKLVVGNTEVGKRKSWCLLWTVGKPSIKYFVRTMQMETSFMS